jgi:hypothetical protein
MPGAAQNGRATPKLREASFEDYPQIALLQAEYGIGGGNYEEWRHLWTGNPAYIDLRGKWPIGWVLQVDGDIVAYKGNIPVLYELRGQRLIAGCGYSWVVASAYRGYSILLVAQYLRQKNAALCLSTTVGAAACNALIALGALPVPVGKWDRSDVWITTYTGFVASWLARKKLPLANLFSPPISAALFARDAILKGRIRGMVRSSKAGSDCTIHWSESFDERFDSFWEALRVDNPNRLLAVRSRAVLEWHFFNALRENRVWIVTANQGSRLCAYGIFLLEPNLKDKVRRVMLVDFQASVDQATMFYPMLAEALDRCRREGVHLLSTIGLCPPGVGDIGLLAPYHVQQTAWQYLYKACDRSLVEVLNRPEVWAPSLFDGDASI